MKSQLSCKKKRVSYLWDKKTFHWGNEYFSEVGNTFVEVTNISPAVRNINHKSLSCQVFSFHPPHRLSQCSFRSSSWFSFFGVLSFVDWIDLYFFVQIYLHRSSSIQLQFYPQHGVTEFVTSLDKMLPSLWHSLPR